MKKDRETERERERSIDRQTNTLATTFLVDPISLKLDPPTPNLDLDPCQQAQAGRPGPMELSKTISPSWK